MSALVFPDLFTEAEFDRQIELIKDKAGPRLMGDPEQLIHSIAYLSTTYQKIAQAVETTWGSEELQGYLVGLITDSTDQHGNLRQGFPPDVMEHLLKLHNLHFRSIGMEIPRLSLWGTR